jgi:pimeloyl-ACP methyl ester carboxylesterase
MGVVQEAIASSLPVVAYDRAGLGLSDSGPRPRDARSIAAELHTALERANIRGPFLLVGHSLGGLFVRVFAGMFPDEVVGMVLVDASHPDQPEKLQRMIRTLAIAGHWCARLGIFRVIDPTRLVDGTALPPKAQLALRAALARTQHWRAARDELAAWNDQTVFQVRDSRWDPARPIAVLTAGDTARQIPETERHRRQFVAMSSRGSYQIVDGATHMSIVTNQNFCGAVVAAIHEVAAEV